MLANTREGALAATPFGRVLLVGWEHGAPGRAVANCNPPRSRKPATVIDDSPRTFDPSPCASFLPLTLEIE